MLHKAAVTPRIEKKRPLLTNSAERSQKCARVHIGTPGNGGGSSGEEPVILPSLEPFPTMIPTMTEGVKVSGGNATAASTKIPGGGGGEGGNGGGGGGGSEKSPTLSEIANLFKSEMDPLKSSIKSMENQIQTN